MYRSVFLGHYSLGSWDMYFVYKSYLVVHDLQSDPHLGLASFSVSLSVPIAPEPSSFSIPNEARGR